MNLLKESVKNFFILLSTILFIAILLINRSLLFLFTKNGFRLWYDTLFPLLMPFMFLSYIWIGFDICSEGKLLFSLLLGTLFGCPIGVAVLYKLYSNNKISAYELNTIAPFCNNLSPAFIMGYFAPKIFPEVKPVIIFILIFAGLLATLVLFLAFLKNISLNSHHSMQNNCIYSTENASNYSLIKILNQSIDDTIKASFKLCICIIIFTIINSSFVLIFKQNIIAVMLSPFIEVSSGVELCSDYIHKIPFLDIICLGAVSFGGISGLFQAITICEGNLSIKKYICIKLLQATLSCIFAIILTYVFKI